MHTNNRYKKSDVFIYNKNPRHKRGFLLNPNPTN